MTVTLRARTAWSLAISASLVGWFLCTVVMVLLCAEVHVLGTVIIGCGALYLAGLGALFYLVLRFLGVAQS